MPRKPKTAEEYVNRGAILSIGGFWDGALANFDEAVRLEPNNASTWHSRGIAWKEKEQLDKAITDFDEAIRLNPDDAGLWRIEVMLGTTKVNTVNLLPIIPKQFVWIRVMQGFGADEVMLGNTRASMTQRYKVISEPFATGLPRYR